MNIGFNVTEKGFEEKKRGEAEKNIRITLFCYYTLLFFISLAYAPNYYASVT